VGLALGGYGAFVAHWGLVRTVLTVISPSCAAFFLSALLRARRRRAPREAHGLFRRLATPVARRPELGDSPDRTRVVFRFLSRATAGVGLLSLLLVFAAAGRGGRGRLLCSSPRCWWRRRSRGWARARPPGGGCVRIRTLACALPARSGRRARRESARVGA
jgi:hypothetical protein